MKILTIILAILIAVDNIAIFVLIDAVQYLLHQDDRVEKIIQLVRRMTKDD